MSTPMRATNHEVRDTAGSYVLAEAGGDAAPAGYKRTEVGVIPEEWFLKQLGDIAVVGSGGTPRRDIAANWNGDVPWITTAQVDFNVICAAEQFLTAEGLKNSAAKLLPAGTLLMALYGQGKTRGKVAMLGFAAATNQACASIMPCAEISPEFLKHFLTSRYEEIRAASNSGSQDNLNGKIVKELPIACPPLAEQRAIAAALSDVDALLAKLDQLIAKKRDLKQAAMQQLLTGNTRLPGFKEKWRSKRLCEVANIQPGINKPLSEMGAGSLYVTVQDVYNEVSIDVSTLGRIRVSPSELDAKELVSGDIVFGKSSVKREGIGHPNIFLGCAERVVFSGFAYRARVLPGLADAKYLFYSLKSTPTRRWLVDNSQASALTNINKSISDAIPVFTPPIEEQTAIATILSDMDTELAALETRRDKTRELKQGMMQALLTGRIRLT